MLKKLAVIGLAAGALVLCAPTVASASELYPEPPNVVVEVPVINTCTTSSVVFGAGYFQAGETVAVGVSGYNAASASYSGNVANAEGGMVLSFRPPADGDGAYKLAFNGSRSYNAVVTVAQGHDAAASCYHDPGVAPAGTELPLTGSGAIELALTGGGISPWVLGGGAVALTAGGILVAAGASRRKRA